jgi:DNA-directed RNA polymerase specialized sigma subunit
MLHIGHERHDSMAIADPNSQNDIHQIDSRDTFLMLVRRLPIKYRILLYGIYDQNQSLTDMALRMNMTASAVSKMHQDALAMLRGHFKRS